MCYRFAASAPFALAEHAGVPAIPPGQARRICSNNLGFLFKSSIQQQQGALFARWTDEFPELTEAYSCAGSFYWAAKGSPLLLPAITHLGSAGRSHPRRKRQIFKIAMPQAGLTVARTPARSNVQQCNGICSGFPPERVSTLIEPGEAVAKAVATEPQWSGRTASGWH